MSDKEEQISEEFARELLDDLILEPYHYKESYNIWKQKGKIKQLIENKKETISEEFAKELSKYIVTDDSKKIQLIVNLWKNEGYIKQTREEDIRNEIDRLTNRQRVSKDTTYDLWEHYCKTIARFSDLVEILDNKIKELSK